MKLGRYTAPLVFIIALGILMILYGAANSFGHHWKRSILAVVLLFLFGLWAGVVIWSVADDWETISRRLLHSVTFACYAILFATVTTDMNFGKLVLVGLIAAILGYFAEWWLKWM